MLTDVKWNQKLLLTTGVSTCILKHKVFDFLLNFQGRSKRNY